MPDLDFALMRMVHSTWALKVRAFLNGSQQIDPNDLISYRDCDLGKWLYSAGLTKYSEMKEIQELEQAHKSMHDLVKRIVDLKRAGKAHDAAQEFLRMHELSKEVVALLTRMEQYTH